MQKVIVDFRFAAPNLLQMDGDEVVGPHRSLVSGAQGLPSILGHGRGIGCRQGFGGRAIGNGEDDLLRGELIVDVSVGEVAGSEQEPGAKGEDDDEGNV